MARRCLHASPVFRSTRQATDRSQTESVHASPTMQNTASLQKVDEYLTVEGHVGGTPLVRLQRLPGQTSNIILAKLEGQRQDLSRTDLQ
ncbi:hypothetical protein WJX77_005122 [Trebouxia sp. C0004]